MNLDPETFVSGEGQTAAPSADFIHAISEFFETDPSDLLVELGYYQREGMEVSKPSLVDAAAPRE